MPAIVSILCLAHYCDTHGPTPLMVTEALPVSCSTCDDAASASASSSSSKRQHTSHRKTSRPSISRPLGRPGTRSEPATTRASPDGERCPPAELSNALPVTEAAERCLPVHATQTPPMTPEKGDWRESLGGGDGASPGGTGGAGDTGRQKQQQQQQQQQTHRHDSSFRKTYDENDRKRATPCDNCALTLPPRKDSSTAPTSMRAPAEKTASSSGPVLRTRKAYQRYVPAMRLDASPPKSDVSACSSESGDSTILEGLDIQGQSTPAESVSLLRRRSSTSLAYAPALSHTHYLDYTSTKEPLAPTSFSVIRQSCLRTLSCETLPPTSSTSSPSPTSPYFAPPTSSSQSGGPILFGDHLAGYTTAYVFRIPDPTARGRRRVYALIALSSQNERLAIQTFSVLSTVFRDLAAWIQGLAEQELERTENAIQSPRIGDDERFPAAKFGFPNRSSSSSFLSGRSRSSDGKFIGLGLRARGLAEIVGLPDFFVELHARFVRLLVELNMMFGS